MKESRGGTVYRSSSSFLTVTDRAGGGEVEEGIGGGVVLGSDLMTGAAAAAAGMYAGIIECIVMSCEDGTTTAGDGATRGVGGIATNDDLVFAGEVGAGCMAAESILAACGTTE